MPDDPYSVLGVAKSASDDEVRRAFRRLAKELHPDVRPNDRVSAERFQKVSAAYEIVGDAEKRAKFDSGEIDASGAPRQQYHRQYAGAGRGQGRGPEDFGFGDVFSDLFGGRGGGPGRQGAGFNLRGQDVRYTLEVDFLEAALGTKKRVTMPEGGQLDLAVPEGVEDGQVLRLRGQGSPGFRGGEAGDALVEIRVRPHPDFRRQGSDILMDLPIALDEAVLGARIEVPTVSGRVTVTVPKGTSSGRSLRLKGKGLRRGPGGLAGDQIVTVHIVLPDQIDDSLAYFLAEWRKKNSYDPRKG